MRVIIAGSRTITDMSLVEAAVKGSCFEVTTVVCGMASGVDTLGREWAAKNQIPVAEYPADWTRGKGAGFERNILMAENADALIAVWDGKSNGAHHMIKVAAAKGLKVYVLGAQQVGLWAARP